MISTLQIQGYRGFEKFEMSGLGRMNLLVGMNNSGKTSVLEALHLLTSCGDPIALWDVLWRRGERVAIERTPQRPEPEVDVTHLFFGHDMKVGSKFKFSAKNESPERHVTFTVTERASTSKRQPAEATERPPSSSGISLQINGSPPPPVDTLQLTRYGGIRSGDFEVPSRNRSIRRADLFTDPVQFITTDSLDSDDLRALWDLVQLTPDESRVLDALKLLNCNIERIASQSGNPYFYSRPNRGGFVVKLAGSDLPIPIGSMGDGMWRLLAMAIAVAQCRNGYLLIDEIDTGLHYSIMPEMWRLLYTTAMQLGVQVFATTHSYDCIVSLAKVCTSAKPNEGITLHRVEAGKVKSVPYTEEEIVEAAESYREVR